MNSDHERHELIRRYMDGTATAEDIRALQEALRANAAFRRQFARYANIDAALGSGRLSVAPVARLAPVPHRPARSWLVPLAAAAAVLVTGLALWFWPRAGDPMAGEPGTGVPAPSQVAIVTQVVDAQWEGVAFQTNDRVPAGRFSLKAGLVRLQFLSGAAVVIEGPAELELTSERGAEVRSGLVTASVPPVAEGFTLSAAGWRAVDRGTVFGIDARSPERTEVHVIEGKVDMHHGTDAAVRHTLRTGQTSRLTPTALVEQAAASARFPREADVMDRAARATRSQLAAWKLRSNTLATDPGLVLYLDFEATDSERGIIRNRAPQADPRSHASVIGGEWTQGRWPGKSAVAFQRVGDLIRTSLRTQLDAATFIVSLRIEPESPLMQTILLTSDVGPGQIYWLISGRGTATRPDGVIFIKTNDQSKDLRFDSKRRFTPPELGQWHTLAVVHDPANHRIRHYLDGTLIKENPLDDAHPLKLRQLVIGNWGFTTEPRNFAGRMDELAVFNRALSEQEIRDLPLSLRP